MDNKKSVGCVICIVVCILYSVVSEFMNIFQGISDDELWYERVTLEDGSNVRVYHTRECVKEKPWFGGVVKKIEFIKHKSDAYDGWCVDEEEMKLLDAISYRNIKKCVEGFYDDCNCSFEDVKWFHKWMASIDTTERGESVYYSRLNDSLIKLDKPECGFSLSDKNDSFINYFGR